MLKTVKHICTINMFQGEFVNVQILIAYYTCIYLNMLAWQSSRCSI